MLDKSINCRVARSANLINNYRLEEERLAQWRYFLGVILRRLTSPYQKGPLSTTPPPLAARPSVPLLCAISSSLTATRRHGAPCGGCGKNPRRTRINAIMNLSRWDLTIQDVAAILPPHLPTQSETLSPAFLVYTKTDFADYMDRDDVT